MLRQPSMQFTFLIIYAEHSSELFIKILSNSGIHQYVVIF